ncbi:MAG: FAD-binding oxidoreductase [Cypionkella sp.]|nr:FAD-binding oxidoreductase [Cypionkella sp.]
MARVDLTVMGGGIFGLSIAWEAARRGARVRVIEARRIGAGSSGGIVGALAPHVPENWNPKKQFQLESLLMAQTFWAEVARAGGQDPGYARLGRWQPLADAAAVQIAQARGAEAATLWHGQAVWRVIPRPEGNWAPISATGLVIEDTLSARLSPRAAARALVAAIRAKGGEVVEGEAKAEGAVVWATGYAGLLDLTAAFARPVGAGVKGQALLLAHDAGDLPQLYAGSLHIVPHGDGTVAIGSTSENTWDDPEATDAQADALLAQAAAACPALEGARILERWAGIRPRARSRAPLLGPWPGRAGHYIANGGFKIGFGMAPKVAQVMADLILSGKDAIPTGFRTDEALA